MDVPLAGADVLAVDIVGSDVDEGCAFHVPTTATIVAAGDGARVVKVRHPLHLVPTNTHSQLRAQT
jgi:anthranilate phosphoribosyltransferase